MSEPELQVIVYSKPGCVQCTSTKRWLTRRGVEYETFDVTTEDGAKGLRKIERWNYTSLPVVHIRKNGRSWKHFSGYQISILDELFPKKEGG